MDFVEDIRVGEKGAETGVGTQENRPPAIFHAWVILRICITKNTSAEGDELFCLLVL